MSKNIVIGNFIHAFVASLSSIPADALVPSNPSGHKREGAGLRDGVGSGVRWQIDGRRKLPSVMRPKLRVAGDSGFPIGNLDLAR
jgi:hypothetical protein